MFKKTVRRQVRQTLLLGASILVTQRLFAVVRRNFTPAHPDVALHAGMELVGAQRRILAIAPHPGDCEFFIGGTLKLLSEGGSHVAIAVLSRGEAAGRRFNMGEVRTREQEASVASIGATLYQLELPDGAFQPSMISDALEDLVARERPDCIFAFDPAGLGATINTDHVAAGAAVLEMTRKGLLNGIRVYLYGTRSPNVLVDITEVLPEKVSAVQCHRSQLKGPDGMIPRIIQTLGKLGGRSTPAMYTEELCRIV